MPIVTPTAGGAVPNVSTIASVNTFADVRLLGAGIFPVIEVLGGATVGDGQDGVFYWNSTSVTADDGFAVLAPSTGVTGRWIRLYGGFSLSSGASHVSTVPSGTGAISETVEAALRRLCFSGQYDTSSHFNTALGALAGTVGLPPDGAVASPSTIANFGWRMRNGGGSNDTFRIGYNLGSTLYAPNLNTEPQAYFGIESLFSGNSEMYMRFEGIGLSGSSDSRTAGFVEPFYSSFNRTTGYISTVAIRAENVVLQNTDQTSYIDCTSARLLLRAPTTVGSSETPLSTLDIQGTSYGASFDGLTIGDNLGFSRLLVGYTSTSIAGSKVIPGQIIWGLTSEGTGEVQIGSRGTAVCGVSIYTSPDAGTTGLVLGLRVSSQGVTNVCASRATPAAGNASAALIFGTTSGFGIYYGSNAPTVSAAKGSLYLRSDGTGTTDRAYINTNGSTTWTALTTVA